MQAILACTTVTIAGNHMNPWCQQGTKYTDGSALNDILRDIY